MLKGDRGGFQRVVLHRGNSSNCQQVSDSVDDIPTKNYSEGNKELTGSFKKYRNLFLLCIICLANVLPHRYNPPPPPPHTHYSLSDVKHMDRKWWETKRKPRRLSGEGCRPQWRWHTCRWVTHCGVHKPSITVISHQCNTPST